jgi:hypothetical protein
MKVGRSIAICTVLLILVLVGTLGAAGCAKKKSVTSGGTATQPTAPLTATPPPAGDKPVGTLQSGAGSRSGSQTAQLVITYGAYALWTGKWDTVFFKFGGAEHKTTWELQQVESSVTGAYDWDGGRINIKQSKTSGLAIGTWSESPTYKPPDDAGDIEVQQSQDGNSFTGKWRYGSSGDWTGEWNGTRIR